MDNFARTEGTFFRIRSERVYAARFTGVVPPGFSDAELVWVEGVLRLRVPSANGPLLAHLGDWILADGKNVGVCDDLIFRRDWVPADDD